MTQDPSPPIEPAPPASSPAADRFRRLRPWVVTLAIAVLTVGVVVYGVTRETPAPPHVARRLANVEVRTVVPALYREALILAARLEADRVAAVSPEFAGRLARWHVPEGGEAAAGQLVAELDTEALDAALAELRARRASAESTVEHARVGLEAASVAVEHAGKEAEVRELALRGALANLELVRTEHARAESLVAQQVLDRARLDVARNALTQAEVGAEQAREALAAARLGIQAAQVGLAEAEARLALARSGVEELDAAVASLEVQRSKTRLLAPIPGMLEKHLAEPGETVESARPLALLYDLDRLRAVVHVPDRFVSFLDTWNPAAEEFVRRTRPGALREVRARVVVPGLPQLTGGEGRGFEVPAELVRIAQASDAESNTFAVELRVPNPGRALRHGMIVRAEIDYLAFPDAVVVPLGAVQVTDAGPRVFVLRRDEGRAYADARDIVPGSIQEDRVQVLEGLAGGESLVVSGWKGLVSGTEVNVVLEDGVFTGGAGEAGPGPAAAGGATP
ncbi:MAG: efflux RND transporter periplasmic adaptor subunit [Deferrisomatales bacterium]